VVLGGVTTVAPQSKRSYRSFLVLGSADYPPKVHGFRFGSQGILPSEGAFR